MSKAAIRVLLNHRIARAVRPPLAACAAFAITGALLAQPASTPAPVPTPAPPPASTRAPARGASQAAAPTPEAWQKDVDVIVQVLPVRHISPFTKVPRERFETAAAELREQVPSLSSEEIAVRMMQIVAMLGDAHTEVDARPVLGRGPLFPLALTPLSDGVLIYAAPAGRQDLVGSTLIAIDQTPIDQAIDRVATVFAWDNESWKLHRAPQFLVQAAVLHALKVTVASDRAVFTVRIADGTERTVEVRSVPPAEARSITAPQRAFVGPAAISTMRRREGYWFEMLPDTRVLYARYDRCADDPGESVEVWGKRLLARLDEGGVDRLVMDLRRNGGGNSALLDSLIDALAQREDLRAKGAIIVLTGRATFSSGQMNAAQLRDRAKAVVVGAPTGQKPNSFGEVKSFGLANSGMSVHYSTKRFQTDPADPPSMMPDIEVEASTADYRAGRDPVLEAAIAYKPD